MTEDLDDERIFQMLYKCNRPTSKTEVGAYFKGEIGPTGIQNALDRLENDGKVVTKGYGKTKIYLVNQDVFQEEDNGELEKKIERHMEESGALRRELESLEVEVDAINNVLSMEELNERIGAVTETTEANRVRLMEIRSCGREISKKDMASAAKAHAKTMNALKKVKKVFNEMIETLSEGMDMKKSQLYEEMGMEM